MPDAEPELLPCVGGPFDGEVVGGWQHPYDTFEVHQRVDATQAPSARPRGRTTSAWASDLRRRPHPAGAHLGFYRLDHTAGQATWVPA